MTGRRVLPTNRQKGPSGKQLRFIKQLRAETGSHGRQPQTRARAVNEIDRLLALKKGSRPRRKKPRSPVRTYFVCPICGWDHARADCPEALG